MINLGESFLVINISDKVTEPYSSDSQPLTSNITNLTIQSANPNNWQLRIKVFGLTNSGETLYNILLILVISLLRRKRLLWEDIPYLIYT